MEVKQMKKLFACIMAIMLLVTSSVTAFAQSEEIITFDDGQFIGITSGNMQRSVPLSGETPIFQNTTITIKHLDIHDDVNIIGKINTTDGEVDFHFIGDIYVSRKQDQGIEAYVGQIVDEENNFSVRYFEIKNDTSYDLLKYSDAFLNKRAISFDLQRNGVNYYFEIDLDALGVTFNADGITQLAPENIDFYNVYVDEEESTAPCTIPYDPEIIPIRQSRSTYEYMEIGEMWYHEQVVNGWFSSNTYEYYALGGTEGHIVDVGKSGSSNWTSALKFWGHVRKDGEVITNQTNYFNIKAGVNSDSNGQPTSAGNKIEFRLYTGANSIFTSGRFDGTCKINGSEKTNNSAKFDLVISLASSIANYVDPYVAGATKVASLASKIFQATSTTSNYQLGQTFITATNSANKYVAGNKFESCVSLDKNEHEIIFTGLVSTIDSSKTKNQSTNCVVQWKYNMCNGNRILSSETVTANVNYIVNMP